MRQIRLLARTFFVRLFESDLMPPGLPQVQLVIWSVVLVATPALTLPGVFAQKYAGLWAHPSTLDRAIAGDRLVLLTLAMVAAGLVALVIWENALPDRRDARILGALPISTSVFVTARLLALGRLFALFFITLGLLPSVLFCGLASRYMEPGGFLRTSAAQVVAALAGTLFIFCLVVAVQCLTIRILGRAMAQRVAIAIQILFAVVLVQMIFFLPTLGSGMRDGMLGPDWLSSGRAAALPSVWFLGLFEVLSGFSGRNAHPLALVALGAVAGSWVAAVALYALGYQTLATQALETPPPSGRGWTRRVAAVLAARSRRRAASGRVAVGVAVRQFTVRTLSRSRQHRTLVALYAGLGLAVVVSSIVPLALQRGLAAFAKPNIAILAAPLVLIFVTLGSMRIAFAIPVAIKANWVVRLGEPADTHAAIDGVFAALLACGAVPFVALGGLSTLVLWGARVAAVHTAVCAVLGWLLAEVLVVRLCKVPFTCTYLPGRSQVKTMWPLYLTAFLTFSYSTAGLELEMLRRPRLFVGFMVIATAGAILTRYLRRIWLAAEPGLRFVEDDPDALFEGFHLSEGLAARPKTGFIGS